MAELSEQANGKRDQILLAAAALFGRRGYHHSTVADVAREAGVATGTIYLYFKRKEEILGSLFRQFLGQYIEDSRREMAGVAEYRARFHRLIELHLEFFEEDPALAAVFQMHLREVAPELREEIGPVVREYFGILEAFLREGVEGGQLDVDLDPRLARSLFFGTLDATVTAWVLAGQSYSLLERTPQLVTMIGRALGLDGQSGPKLG